MTDNETKVREVLNRVHEFLSNLCRDARCDDHCSECLGASDLADDVYDLIHTPTRNCDRFATETDAQIAFLREVWLIGVSDLDRDPFDGWTNEMKSAYSKWLFAPATEKEGGNA